MKREVKPRVMLELDTESSSQLERFRQTADAMHTHYWVEDRESKFYQLYREPLPEYGRQYKTGHTRNKPTLDQLDDDAGGGW